MKSLLQSLFFFLLLTQICFGQWSQNYNRDDIKNRLISHQSGSNTQKSGFQKKMLNKKMNESMNDPSTAWIVHYASGLIPSFDWVNDFVIDPWGNIYVTGVSVTTGKSGDFTTIKYNPSGNVEWVVHYNGTGSDWDEAIAIALDQMGDIYVTGKSIGLGTGVDYVTIKYNLWGFEEWVAQYDGPVSLDDIVSSIAVDASGYVYVTGGSEGADSGIDYATIKYSTTGNEEWVVRYNGPGNESDEATAIVVDASSNIYVTGRSRGSESNDDYATVKYNSSGSQRWVRRFNGPNNEIDQAYDMTLDASGNVYVTGISGHKWWGWTSADYATIKYNTAGTQEWISYYDGPSNGIDLAKAIEVDQAGNVYVTGESEGIGTSDDFATIKYSPAGGELWVARYNGPENNSDGATSLVVDINGNVYVTGGSGGMWYWEWNEFATVKYNSAGNEEWTARFSASNSNYKVANAISVDDSGNVYITGGNGDYYSNQKSDYITIKYSSSGNELLLLTYDGPGNSIDEAADMVVDNEGNIYLTGKSVDSSGNKTDYLTIKYSTTGTLEWAARYNGPADGNDRATAIAIDQLGNVYVTGESEGIGTEGDYATIKYDPSGNEMWIARYNGPGNSVDCSNDIAVDMYGNIYVTGGSSASSSDFATIKYNATGSEEWVVRYDYYGWDYYNETATGIVVDLAGNVYVSGYQTPFPNFYITIKYNSSGSSEWVHEHYQGDGPNVIALDSVGNVYVSGTEWRSGSSYIYTVFNILKYSNFGNWEWYFIYGNKNLVGGVKAIDVDKSGNVFVTGTSSIFPSGSGNDYTTIKYNQTGNEEWVVRYDNGNDGAEDIALDAAGNIFVTGVSDGGFATVKYTPDGTEEWVTRYNGPGNVFNNALRIGLSQNGEKEYVCVAGSSIGQGWSTFTTIKYEQNPSSIDEQVIELPTEYLLSQNYPNPFNPSTVISYQLPVGGNVALKVYDILGNEIATLVDVFKPAGRYEVEYNAASLPSGVYFCQLMTGDFIQTKKMLLLK